MISCTDSEDRAARTAATREVITNFAQPFYLERIGEHWDVIQPIPETAYDGHPLP